MSRIIHRSPYFEMKTRKGPRVGPDSESDVVVIKAIYTEAELTWTEAEAVLHSMLQAVKTRSRVDTQ